MKVVIACGGTGGHLFPGLAVAEELLRRGHEVRLLVSQKAIDQTALAGFRSGADTDRFSVGTMAAVGYGPAWQRILFSWRLVRAVQKCRADYARFETDIVLGMGGFTSAPAIMAAWSRRMPTVIHESNAVPGKANRCVGRWVDHVAVGMAECAQWFGHTPVTVTGTPVREVVRRGKVADALSRLGLENGRLTVAVMGGSQGAHALNTVVMESLPQFEAWRERMQFMHLAGAADETAMRAEYEKKGFKAVVIGFCKEMELVYSAADVVVARAGAATLTEIAAFGLPAILVPFPQAANNHQWYNAQAFVRAGAAQVVEQITTSGMATFADRFANALTSILGDSLVRAQMASRSGSLAITDASERIANLLEQYA